MKKPIDFARHRVIQNGNRNFTSTFECFLSPPHKDSK
jgi:hypothetical protein